jgi:uncharacterized protein (DUF1015 family)
MPHRAHCEWCFAIQNFNAVAKIRATFEEYSSNIVDGHHYLRLKIYSSIPLGTIQ